MCSRMLFSSSASPDADASVTVEPSVGDVVPGSLITYQRDRDPQPSVALVVDAVGKRKWGVLTPR